ncbi:MAG: glycosyltransferase family 4 protein [bacterium]|nr:glycosyltransferase family 4 protein [bacterium]
MMNIIIFSTAYLPFWGGAEIAVKELTDRIGGCEFDLITARLDRRLPKFERLGRVNVYRVGLGWRPDKFLLPFLGLWQALRLDKSCHYQIIFSLMASQASIAAAWFKMLCPEKKLLLNLQEGDEEEHLKRYALGSDWLYNRLIKPWHLLVFKKADLVVAISGYLKQRAQASGVKCEIEVVPNGVNMANYELRITNYELRKKLGIGDKEKVVITVSRLVKKNGVEYLIEAMRYLPENVKLIIIGSGELELNLKSKIANLKLAGRVLMLGEIGNQSIPEYLSAADVFVRPSLSEGQGISFLEAMAAGVPIIGTPVGGIPDFLRDGETGLFCKANNPQSIAEQVKALLNNKELADKITASALRLVKEKYDWNFISEKYAKIFHCYSGI